MPPLYSLDALFLCVLLRGPNYGLGIAQALEELDPSSRPQQGGIYPALQRIEESGWVTSSEAPAAGRGGRPRRQYTLTASGRQQARKYARMLRQLTAEAAS